VNTYTNKQSAQQTEPAIANANKARNKSTALQLEDNRPGAAHRVALQALADRSPRAQRLTAMQAMTADSSRVRAQNQRMQVLFGADGNPSGAPAAQRSAIDMAAAHGPAEQTASSVKRNETGLPDKLKNGVEALSGISMDNVRVHYNSSRPAQLQAHAYAQGSDIHLAPGQERHLPHEAWHVVQQAQSKVKPTMQLKIGVMVNDDQALEHEADAMGARAASLGVLQGKALYANGIYSNPDAISLQHAAPIQMNPVDRMKSGLGLGSASLGLLATAGLMSGPIGWGIMGAGAAGLLTTAAASYFMGSDVPEPITVNGHFADGQIKWDYKYDVVFEGQKATIHLDFYMSANAVPEDQREAYIKRVKEKVAEIFDNKINITVGKQTYNAVISVNAAFDDHQVRIPIDVQESRKLTLHDTAGRSNAMELHSRSDNTGYVGAHEVGHHLGLIDEYRDAELSPDRWVFVDNGIMTAFSGTPHLPERNIKKIKQDIESSIQERTRKNENEKRWAAQAKNGHLPTL
jgi:hypothetical protein